MPGCIEGCNPEVFHSISTPLVDGGRRQEETPSDRFLRTLLCVEIRGRSAGFYFRKQRTSKIKSSVRTPSRPKPRSPQVAADGRAGRRMPATPQAPPSLQPPPQPREQDQPAMLDALRQACRRARERPRIQSEWSAPCQRAQSPPSWDQVHKTLCLCASMAFESLTACGRWPSCW